MFNGDPQGYELAIAFVGVMTVQRQWFRPFGDN